MFTKLLPRRTDILSLMVLSLLVSTLVACGGTSSKTTPPTTPTAPSASTAPAMINVGDSPSDQVVAFAMPINSITMTGSKGSVTVVSSPTTVEMTRLAGTEQPLSLVNLPQDTYTSMTINTGSATVSFMNPGNPVAATQTVSVPSTTVNFSSPVTVGTTPVVVNLDISISGGNVSVRQERRAATASGRK